MGQEFSVGGLKRGVGVVLEYAEQGLNDLLGRKGVSILCML